MTEETQPGDSTEGLICPACQADLPAERRAFPWCECGWNLPPDPIEELRGWKRRSAEFSRRIGKLQADSDLGWSRREGIRHRLVWHLLSILVLLLAVLSFLVQVGYPLLLVALVLVGVYLFRFNCVIGLGVVATVLGIAYLYGPKLHLGRLFRRKRRTLDLEQERVLETVVDVAQRLGADPPTAIAFAPFPHLAVLRVVHWTFPPRWERVFYVGLPVLAVLNMTEFKTVAGHALVSQGGARAWFLPAAERVLHWCRDAIQLLLSSVEFVVGATVILLGPLFACFFVGAASGDAFAEVPLQVLADLLQVIGPIAAALVAGIILLGGLLWLAALWDRRNTLLADRKVAEAFGRNVFREAFPKLWVAQRSFERQWGPMWEKALDGKEELNLYAQFRDRWQNLDEAFKQKAYREITTEYRTLIHVQPIFEDRLAALADLPDKLYDDRPAAQLLPNITAFGANLTQDML